MGRSNRKAGISVPGILAVDIGGTTVKILASGDHEPRKIPSGRKMSPSKMVSEVLRAAGRWKFDVVSIGYPGLVGDSGPRSEALNLGSGWVGFDFAAAFGKPVKIINDAAMQALGSYDGGRMLFVGLGTGLGSALITGRVIVPLELGELPYADNERLGLVVGRRGLKRLGNKKWRVIVCEMLDSFARAFVVDYVVLGGGNAKLLKKLPSGVRLGHNLTAFRGGFRLWNVDDVRTLAPGAEQLHNEVGEWRVA